MLDTSIGYPFTSQQCDTHFHIQKKTHHGAASNALNVKLG